MKWREMKLVSCLIQEYVLNTYKQDKWCLSLSLPPSLLPEFVSVNTGIQQKKNWTERVRIHICETEFKVSAQID